MSELRKGRAGVQTYHYFVEKRWIDGKIKQKVIKYLEPDVLVVELDREQTIKAVEETFRYSTGGIEGEAQTSGDTHSRGNYWRNESNTQGEKMHS